MFSIDGDDQSIIIMKFVILLLIIFMFRLSLLV